MPTAIAPDDIVERLEEADGNERPPLLVLEPLRAFFDDAGLGSGDIEVEPVGDGHSNVTYVIRRGDEEFVLRRPPRPPLPPSAHNVLREARLLSALEPTDVRTPAILATCDDEAVVGAPFYVMERMHGEVITDSMPQALDTPEERRRIADELIDALVELHAIDWQAIGLDDFGRPSGYLERQLKRFLGLWEHNKTRELDAVERVGAWLSENLPESPEATIVHGDYRLGNTMMSAEPPARLVAIFDWEMATIGDPLADMGYLCALWTQHDDPHGGLREHLGKVTRLEGFPTRDELVERYAEKSGRSVGDLRWYVTLAVWKSIVFMEGNYKRAVSGSTDDPYLKQFGDGVVELAERAEELITA
jgi:aminoglycoside phosphotransferase (APT) family kinase protein